MKGGIFSFDNSRKKKKDRNYDYQYYELNG